MRTHQPIVTTEDTENTEEGHTEQRLMVES